MPSEAELESPRRAALQGHTSQGRAFPAAGRAAPAHHPELRWTRCPPAPGFDLGLSPAPQIPPEPPAGLSGFAVLAKPFHTDTALLQLPVCSFHVLSPGQAGFQRTICVLSAYTFVGNKARRDPTITQPDLVPRTGHQTALD